MLCARRSSHVIVWPLIDPLSAATLVSQTIVSPQTIVSSQVMVSPHTMVCDQASLLKFRLLPAYPPSPHVMVFPHTAV